MIEGRAPASVGGGRRGPPARRGRGTGGRPSRWRRSAAPVLLLALAASGPLASPRPAAAQGLSERERAVVEWIDGHREEAVDLLREQVEIGSGTLNPAGVRAVGEVLARELRTIGFETRWEELPAEMARGPHLFARHEAGAEGAGRRLLLIGHLDTVFEEDDPFRGFRREGDRAVGPGVSDMKGGNAVIVMALRALASEGLLEDADIVVAFTGDEEAPGEPLERTRRPLIEAGRWADVALGFEGGIRDAESGREWATVARRSSSDWRLDVTGRQAHSSSTFSEETGAGAIFEAARILADFYDEVRGERYLTFNAGVVLGGTEVAYDPGEHRGTAFGKTNVVPRTAVVHGGIRAISAEQLEGAEEAMRRVVTRHLPHTSAKISFSGGYPPMSPTEGNRRLMALLNEVQEDLGREPMAELDPSRRGAADISFVAPHTDALAGLGVYGGNEHAPGEWVELSSLPLAAKRAALLIHRLTEQERTR